MYVRLLMASMVSVVVSAAFYILQRKTPFNRLPYWLQQAIIGVVFGCVAILGTEYGVPVNGTATANARDAAPLCAGLLFGAPAGIIAGLIGGVERWFAALWGAGMYSRVACTVSTIFAGVYAAILRKRMFDNKRPTIGFGFAAGVVMEVIHLSVLFLTHISDSATAYGIVKAVTFPMIICNAVSIGCSLLMVTLISSGLHRGENRGKSIAQKVQARMLICVVVAYVATTAFVYALQTNTAYHNADDKINIALSEVKEEIEKGNENFVSVTKSHHVGDSGYVLVSVLDENTPHPDGVIKPSDVAAFGINYTEKTEDLKRQKDKIKGRDSELKDSVWMCVRTDKYCIFGIIPNEEVFADRDASVYINSYMEVLVFATLFALIYMLIKRLVVDNIRNVNDKLEQIIGGDLTVKVDVHASSEFSSLSEDINSTVTTLKHYIDEAAARIDKELEFARNIQNSALPSVFPDNEKYGLYASMNAAKEVGGDFYDFYTLPEGKVAFLVADVSGKGIPAAMFMMRAKTMIKAMADEGHPTCEILARANNRLCEGNDAGMFVTAWMGILDTETGEVRFSNAGHNPPLIYRKESGTVEYLKSRKGLVLAGMEDMMYPEDSFVLNKGDRIFLYTDGATEAQNINREFYGEERLKDTLSTKVSLPLCEVVGAVKSDIDEFVGEADQFDDITLLTVERK